MNKVLRKLQAPRFQVIEGETGEAIDDIDTRVYAFLKELQESRAYHEWVRGALKAQFIREELAKRDCATLIKAGIAND